MKACIQGGFWDLRAGAFTMAGLGLFYTALMILAAAIPTAASAATWPVTNCRPAGPGSLHDAVSRAGEGDTVDLTQAGCKRIELTGKPIMIPQNALRIVGPGRSKMTIDGNGRSSIFRHTGNGTLRIKGVSFAHGQHKVSDADGRAEGGCIYSAGRVTLDWSDVHHCTVYGYYALGGGIYALSGATVNYSQIFSNEAFAEADAEGGGIYGAGAGTTHLNYSQIFDNTVSASLSNSSYGGGVRASNLAMNYSMLTENYAGTSGSTGGIGGGAYISGIAEVKNSTVAGNIAEYQQGGVGGSQVTVANSTFSGNRAPRAAALGAAELHIYYSTIAFNDGFSAACSDSAAVVQDYRIGNLFLFSSILANNTCDGQPSYDVWSEAGNILAEANIVEVSKLTLPPDTICADPMLEPLADNGGIGLTHALKTGSPAIDTGSNTFSEIPSWDQRGTGFPRIKGAEPDVGAYEY